MEKKTVPALAENPDHTAKKTGTGGHCPGTVFTAPAEIEAESMRRITAELTDMGIHRPEEEMQVIRRVIHTTADFDFARTMVFTDDAVRRGREAILSGQCIITDTNMVLAGISRPSCERFGNRAMCFMADPAIIETAKTYGTTRAYAAMGYAATNCPEAIYAVGNAPTALFRLEELLREGTFLPSLIIAVPVGFVNVVEAKEQILEICRNRQVPVIAAMGRKGGSTVAAAIMNALFYGIDGRVRIANRV